jgi:predicted glycosyltransferase
MAENTMPRRVLFYVQHLIGIGHVVRAARIARALCAHGFDVKIAFGGRPVAAIDWGRAELVYLASLRAGPEGFGSLVDEDGVVASDGFKAARCEQLTRLVEGFAPHIVLIEAYPFARRIMRFELRPMIVAARAMEPRPLIVSSIRDILQEGRKPQRIAESLELVDNLFDAVLVHGDERFVPLEASFPEAGRIGAKLHYSGIVAPEPSASAKSAGGPKFEVIVSAGGGAVGGALLEAACKAMPASPLAAKKWLFLSGPNLADDAFNALEQSLPVNANLERFRADLPDLFATAELSISQAGYNTVADILNARCRAVLVPFAAGGETEQTKRAELLAAKGLAAWVGEADLTSEDLVAAITCALALDPLTEAALPAVNGAARSAQILSDLLDGLLDQASINSG